MIEECPDCGCPELELIVEGEVYGYRVRTVECDHCGRRLMDRADGPKAVAPPAVSPEPISQETEVRAVYGRAGECPHCGGPARTTSTRKGFRYVKCQSCRKSWKQTVHPTKVTTCNHAGLRMAQ